MNSIWNVDSFRIRIDKTNNEENDKNTRSTLHKAVFTAQKANELSIARRAVFALKFHRPKNGIHYYSHEALVRCGGS